MEFDAFLSHNSQDKPAVRELAQALKEHGLKVWLDEWNLLPGRPWQEALEDGIRDSKAAVVVVGPNGLGAWEIPEMRVCIDYSIKHERPVIPVLLPGATEISKLPLFLQRYMAVDLRHGLNKPELDRLAQALAFPEQPPQPRPPPIERQHPDIYISFSPIDNKGFDNKGFDNKGWIDEFQTHLEVLLAQRLGSEVNVQRSPLDEGAGTEPTADRKQVIEHSQVFLALLSPASLKQDSCIRERKLFGELDNLVANPSAANDRLRIIGVLLQNLPIEQRPRELQSAEIFEFFDQDNYRLEVSDNLYKKRLRRLVDSIVEIRELMEKEAMSGLHDAWSEPDVQAALRQALADSGLTLEEIENQIVLVSDLKEVHDILHRIRIESYKELQYLFHADTFPSDPGARFELRDVDESLGFFSNSLGDIQARNPDLTDSLRWVGELDKAHREVHSGLQEQDFGHVKQGLFGIKRVLFKYPSRINADLTKAARRLGLAKLVEKIQRVMDELRHSGMMEERIGKLSAGVEVLKNIDSDLTQLVKKHDSWQVLDDELRRIEETLEVDATELQTSWEYIRGYAVDLYGEDQTAWPPDLVSLSAALEGKDGILDRTKVESDFRHFRSYAGQRFDFANQDLKRQCEKARRIAHDLSKIIPLRV